MRADSLSSTEEATQRSTSTSRGVFPQEYVLRRTLCFLLQVKLTPRCPDSKEGQISMQRLNAGSSFILQVERMSESPVETLQKALGPYLISKRGLTSVWQLERHTELRASKVDDAWPFLNNVRNPNITVPTREWPSVSRLISRRVRIVVPSLVLIPEVSIITRQVSRLRWTNTRFDLPSPPKLENIPQVPDANREKSWDFLLGEKLGPISLPCLHSNSFFPIKHVRNLDLLDGTAESHQEHPHKFRMTLMSPKECEIIWCFPNQLEMTPLYWI